jgi:heptosyltransferase-2
MWAAGLQAQAVLVIGPNWVGDAVMATPVLANLRRSLPKAKIDVLVPSPIAPLFEDHPHVDRVLTHPSRRTWRAAWRRLRALRQLRYEVAVVLPNSLRAALWAWAIGARLRVGYATDGRRWLLTHAVAATHVRPRRGRDGPSAIPHQIDAYLRLVEALGLPVQDRLPVLVPSRAADLQAERLWTSHGLPRRQPVVGLCPGAAFGPAKRWCPERFAALAERLTAAGIGVVLLGSGDEVPLVERIRRQLRHRVVSLAGQDTLASFAALAARCAVLVTNDSGAMHIAGAVGTPVVAIFGPTDPRRTGPRAGQAVVLRRPVPCAPCFRRVCPYPQHPCMQSIAVDDVYDAIWRLLPSDAS